VLYAYQTRMHARRTQLSAMRGRLLGTARCLHAVLYESILLYTTYLPSKV
jgi:hypothetical protein